MHIKRIKRVLYLRWAHYAADHHDIYRQNWYYICLNDRLSQIARIDKRERNRQE